MVLTFTWGSTCSVLGLFTQTLPLMAFCLIPSVLPNTVSLVLYLRCM